MSAQETKKRRRVTAKEAAERLDVSERTIRRLVAQPRDEWIREQFERRERIRAYKYDEGHTWGETAAHFGVTKATCQDLARRARKERAQEAQAELDRLQPPLPLDDIA